MAEAFITKKEPFNGIFQPFIPYLFSQWWWNFTFGENFHP
jgi:hypothetical protein